MSKSSRFPQTPNFTNIRSSYTHKMLRTALRTPITSALRVPVSRYAVSPAVSTPIRSSFLRLYSAEAKKDEAKNDENKPEEEAEIAEKDEVSKLTEELEAAKKEVAHFKDHYLRSIADFRNLQESTKREIKKAKDLALKSFAKDLLEVADTFEIALKTLETESGESPEKQQKELKDLIEGVKLTQSMFLNTLKRHGLEQIDAIDQKFDPNVHEATFEVPQPDKEAGTVFFVQQPGYYLNKRVLRPAKVGIVKGSD